MELQGQVAGGPVMGSELIVPRLSLVGEYEWNVVVRVSKRSSDNSLNTIDGREPLIAFTISLCKEQRASEF
jgi:hypothetical protein